MLGGASRILDAEVAGGGGADLQGQWWFWARRWADFGVRFDRRGQRLWGLDGEGSWVEVVAHIGCTGIQGLPHARK